MPTRISARDWGQVIRRRLQADTEVLRRVAVDVAARGEAAAVEDTEALDLVDRGRFKRGWGHRAIPEGAVLYNDAPYAPAIEHGRRPGQPGPPLAPIKAWVQRKLVAEGKVAPEDVDSAAYAIRNAIRERGTPPKFVLRDLKPRLATWFKVEARRQLQQRRTPPS